MAYWKKSWRSTDKRIIEVEKYHSAKAMPVSASVRERRASKSKETTEAQSEINERQRARKLQHLIWDNFSAGDWYITLTYAENVSDDEARDCIGKFMDSVRRKSKRLGVEFRWIKVTEHTKRGRTHYHLLVNKEICKDFASLKAMIEKRWTHGMVKIECFGGAAIDGHRLASYHTKEKSTATISTSRNLIRREPKKKKISRAETYRDEIVAPKGYHVLPELSYNGWTKDGYPYQHAVFERDEGAGR